MDYNNINHLNIDIKFFQINLNRCISATSLLINHIYEKRIHIVLVEEPYLVNNRVALFPFHFHIIQSSNRPKCAIIIYPIRIKVMPINQYIEDYSVWCVFNYNNKLIYICSAYLPPDPHPTKRPEEILDSLNNFINTLKPTYYLVGSDTNGKSKLWKNRTNNRRGNLLLNFYLKINSFF
jgi:hypothetical protein